jgi:hypothetical protein
MGYLWRCIDEEYASLKSTILVVFDRVVAILVTCAFDHDFTGIILAKCIIEMKVTRYLSARNASLCNGGYIL